MIHKMKTVFTTLLLLFTMAGFAMPQDSIGVKVVGGKRYIMHKVTKGEGVYGISKKYGVSASDIYASNEGSDKTIQIGQTLLIPKGTAKGTGTPSSTSSTTISEKVYHTVASGQTLSSIAKTYETSVSKIKEMNNLKSDNINLGQKLVVGEKKSTIAAETTVKTTKQETVKEEVVVEKPKTEAPKNVVVNTSAEKPKESATTTINTYAADDGDEVNENGMAVISTDGDLNQERSFIMHPTAKVGTIVMITNSSNNNAVFARVIGNCKVDHGTVLKMSKTVAMKLGVSENTAVKVSYAK